MKNYASNRVRNVVLLGHRAPVKPHIPKQRCIIPGNEEIRQGGRRNTVSDYEAEEIRRKVSINTSVIPVEWQDTKINFLDTPGYLTLQPR